MKIGDVGLCWCWEKPEVPACSAIRKSRGDSTGPYQHDRSDAIASVRPHSHESTSTYIRARAMFACRGTQRCSMYPCAGSTINVNWDAMQGAHCWGSGLCMYPHPHGCQIGSSGCVRAAVASQLTLNGLPAQGYTELCIPIWANTTLTWVYAVVGPCK